MDLDLAPAIESFLEEAADFVVQLEEDIMALEESPQDDELINSAFRAAHTIKGSGGLFGFDGLVKVTHVFESVLMRMRDGALVFNKEISEVMLAGVDHLGQILQYIDLEGEHIPEEVTEAGDQLGVMLEMYLDQPASEPTESAAPSAEKAQSVAAAAVASSAQCPHWLLSLRFGEDVLRHGMDPSSFLRYLQRLGEIVSLKTLPTDLPTVEEIDPERNYLGFEIQLQSDASREELLDVFEFVQEQSLVLLLPPQSPLGDYRQQLKALPEPDEMLADLWKDAGALSEDEHLWCLSDGEIPEAEAITTTLTGSDADLTLAQEGNDTLLVIAEPMTIYRAEAISAQLNFSLSSYPQPVTGLKVDLSAVEEIDTAGMQILVSLKKSLATTDGRIVQVVHCDASRALFDLYRLELDAA